MARRFAKPAGVPQKDFRPMLEVEFALFVLTEFAPGESAKDAWALVSGYDFRRAGHRLGRVPAAIRWLLEPVRSEHEWTRLLAQYQVFAQQARMFDVPDVALPPVPRTLVGGAAREDQYRELLAALPPHKLEDPLVAELGVRHRVRRTGHSVIIPAEIVAKRPPRHRPMRARKIFTFTWSALRKTAMSMDAQDHKCGRDNKWLERIEDLELVVDRRGKQVTAKKLQLKNLLHVVGMPAVGKTTLIVVASVLASRRKHHVTVVLGDVVSVLTVVRDLERYDVAAAPILGSASRGRHLQQLHRPAVPEDRGLPLLMDERMKWVSTACPLQGLLDLPEPWPLLDAPCDRGLEPWLDHDDAVDPHTPPKPCSCPLFGDCGRHEAARKLATARVWVATSASLLHCRVPSQLTDNSMRYLEMAWARSDVFLVDEADRVQIQWDQAFSPSQKLTGSGSGAWLDEVHDRLEGHLRATRSRDLASSSVRDWSVDINAAKMLVSRIRSLISEHAHLPEWLSEGYFNEWRLSLRLALEISQRTTSPTNGGKHATTTIDQNCDNSWRRSFAEWVQRPDASRGPGTDRRANKLRELATRVLDPTSVITDALKEWLENQPDVVLLGQPLERLAVRLHLTMLIALLAKRLEVLTRMCWEVENATGVDDA